MNQENIHKHPRMNARTCLALCKGTPEELVSEMAVELVLDDVCKAIGERLEYILEEEEEIKDEDLHINVTYHKDLEDEVVIECNARLRDLGYTVQYIVDTQEELDFLQELDSEEDELISNLLEEMMDTGREFRVSWNQINGC